MSRTFDSQNDAPIRDVWALLRRRKWLILLVIALGIGSGFGVSLAQQRIYGASVRIFVEGRTKENPNPETRDPVISDISGSGNTYDVASQIEVLESQQILVEAFQDVGLQVSRSMFSPDAVEKVAVKQLGSTNVLELTVTSLEADKAVKLAESVPKVYREYLRRVNKAEVENGITFINFRLGEESRRLKEAQDKLDAFRQKNKVLDVDVERQRQAGRVGQAGDAQRTAAAMVATAQARLNDLVKTRQRTPEMVEVPNTEANREIDEAKRLLTSLEAQRADLLTHYLEDHENVKKIDAQIATQKQYLASLPAMSNRMMRVRNPQLDSLEARITEARAELQAANANFAKASQSEGAATQSIEEFTKNQRQLEDLQRDVSERLLSVQNLTRSLDGLRLRSKTVRDPVQNITPVTEPLLVQPKQGRNLAMGALLGVFAAIGLALWRDHSDDRIYSTHEANALCNLEAIGYIPTIRQGSAKPLPSRRRGDGKDLALNGASPPNTKGRDPGLVPYQQLRSNVSFVAEERTIQSLLVTSASPGDGKSFVVTNLGICSASKERRVLIVDTHFKRPAQHSKFGIDLSPGLAEVLAGTHTLDDVVKETEHEGLWMMPAGMLEAPAPEALSSDRMRELHDEMRDKFSFIVFDSPPTSRAIDSQLLASLADGVLYVVQTGNTRRTSLRYGMAVLQKANARVLGLVYNKVKVNEDNVPLE